MKPGRKGTVLGVRPTLSEGRLRVSLRVKSDDGQVLEAGLPDREVSAILPRSVLLGGASAASPTLLGTIEPILARMAEGRAVRIWEYKERRFCSFQSWKGVRFLEESPAVNP